MDLKGQAQSIMTPFEHLEDLLLPNLRASRRVALLASGGFDSTMLLSATLEICRRHEIERAWLIITVPRHDASWDHAGRVCEWASKRWNTLLPMVRLGDPDLHHSQQVASGCRLAAEMGLADLYLLGDTAVPIELSDQAPVRVRANDPRWMQPWFDLTKDHVVMLMRELGLQEVMELTHTCTASTSIRCGKCWQCRERAWAFGRAGISDTGRM
jgi:hypothetical protein